MAHLITDWYQDFLSRGDPRTADWLGMSSPIPTMLISLSYVVLVTRVGPSLMRNRKPFELKNVLIVYNALQVIASILLWTEGGLAGWFTTYSYRCQPIDYSNDPYAIRSSKTPDPFQSCWSLTCRVSGQYFLLPTHDTIQKVFSGFCFQMARVTWYYYILKFTELLDTVFFVLRKKNRQISTLHVIHHGIMPVSVWFGVKFFPGGGGTFFGFINTFVHIVMYAYYLLAALGPAVQPYLWWKRYLTQLQLVQFVIVIIHTTQTLIIDCDKSITRGLKALIIGHGVMFLGLFLNFYYQAYLSRAKAKKTAETNGTPTTVPKKSHPGFANMAATDAGAVRQRGLS